MKRAARFVVAGLGGLVAVAAAPRAEACGGFFCNNQQPVDQSGEQIIFSVSQSHVTAHIQISYQGAAQDFAWVVPVQTKPTLSVGSQTVFQAVAQRTQPQFTVDWNFLGGGYCGGPQYDGPVPGAANGGGVPPMRGGDTGVMVIEQKEVGPYDSVILSATNGDALVKWLNDNKFAQPPSATPLIKHYVDLGMFFVALKLQQNATAGEIQPIVLDMDNPDPCIPLILTQVAAVPDMPVQVYMLSKAQASPKNWFHVVVNERKIDWLNNGANYKDVVTKAVNEAAGHGFVTEFAGKSDILKNSVYIDGRFNTAALRNLTDAGQFVQALQQMGFSGNTMLLALLRMYIPLPQALKDMGVTEQAFYNSPASFQAAYSTIKFDPNAFADALEMRVVKPLRDAQAMFDAQPYLTRLFTTVSPEEMTRDPLFHENPDLTPVNNLHRALGSGECAPDGSVRNISLTLESGGEPIKIPGPWRRFATPAAPWTVGGSEPAALRIELVGTSGLPTSYSVAQAKVADGYLDKEDPDAVRGRTIVVDPGMTGGTGGGTGGKTGAASSSSCAFGRAAASPPLVAMFVVALGLIVRRRRSGL